MSASFGPALTLGQHAAPIGEFYTELGDFRNLEKFLTCCLGRDTNGQMSRQNRRLSAQGNGKRPSDAISISDDEEDIKADAQRIGSAREDGTFRNPLHLFTRTEQENIGVLEALDPSTINNRRVTKTNKWAGWDKTCFSKPLKEPVLSENSNCARGTCEDGIRTIQGPQNTFPQTPQIVARVESDLKPLTYWRCREGNYWTHELYRSTQGQEVKVYYCRTLVESERVAMMFANEPALGLDLEWKPRGSRGIKQNISLIQLACEDKIGLFHVALHDGRSTNKLLAPSLRKIIESPKIKAGVAIVNADGHRLRKYMKLTPCGLLELSHLHKIVKFADRPEMINRKLISLASLVHMHLGKPLFKGKVRTSDWTQPLDEDQIRYSAADAYAGYRLFRTLDMKRLKLSPVPDLPLPLPLLNVNAVDSDSKLKHMDTISGLVKGSNRAADLDHGTGTSIPEAQAATDPEAKELDAAAKRALSAIRGLRIRLAKASNANVESIALDSTIIEIARKRPRQREELEQIPDCRNFVECAWKEGIDVIQFLQKFAPEMHE
ncbi:MAG: hypothetical protein M1820_010718 [Bogoriella megaspora]|nr:MAG: hypothetical protein M1820_010718 [Bogoriella megaspora]